MRYWLYAAMDPSPLTSRFTPCCRVVAAAPPACVWSHTCPHTALVAGAGVGVLFELMRRIALRRPIVLTSRDPEPPSPLATSLVLSLLLPLSYRC